jgi:hypothetical protein
MIIDSDEFKAWKNNRNSKKMFQFFKERAEGITSAWINGEFQDERSMIEGMAEARAMLDLINLEYEDVLSFYNIEPKEDEDDDNETET